VPIRYASDDEKTKSRRATTPDASNTKVKALFRSISLSWDFAFRAMAIGSRTRRFAISIVIRQTAMRPKLS
jgi:hypothetical protein